MKIEAGKYYRTRGGYVVGPMEINLDDPDRPWCDQTGMAWPDNGKYDDDPDLKTDINGDSLDLISEVYVSDTPPENAPEAKTLRDEFAFEAMKKLMDTSGLKAAAHHEEANRTGLAKLAYGIADAMMEAREK
jgi:hypothetical protein